MARTNLDALVDDAKAELPRIVKAIAELGGQPFRVELTSQDRAQVYGALARDPMLQTPQGQAAFSAVQYLLRDAERRGGSNAT